jgi:hypothetical protein
MLSTCFYEQPYFTDSDILFLSSDQCSYCYWLWIKTSRVKCPDSKCKCNGMFCSSEIVWNNVPVSLAVLQDVFEYSYPPLPDDDFQPPLSESGQGEAGGCALPAMAHGSCKPVKNELCRSNKLHPI